MSERQARGADPGEPTGTTRIPTDELTSFVTDLLTSVGATAENAACVAESLVAADLAGHGSHGVMKLPSYLREIAARRLDPAATPTILRETSTTAKVDATSGFGHVAGHFATDVAVEKAGRHGLGAVVVSRAHHTGRLGNWAERIAAAQMIGLLTGGEGQPPHRMAPHGGRDGALATNPVACAVPRAPGAPPILLDYATSVASIGKIQLAQGAGASIPGGWLIDADGRPSTDPGEIAADGRLLPFGEHKGYALAVIAELLAVGLSGGADGPAGERSSCLFVLAISPAQFTPTTRLHRFADMLDRRLRAVARLDANTEVLVPGDPEARARTANATGVPIQQSAWDALLRAAEELNLRPPVHPTRRR